jgi:hypothetical protein
VFRNNSGKAATTSVTIRERKQQVTRSASNAAPKANRPIVAVVLALCIVAVALATGVFRHELTPRLAGDASFGWPALSAGHWWSLLTSLLLTRNWFMAVTMPLAVAGALGVYEVKAGSARALVVAVLGHVTGSVVVALGAGAAGTTGDAILVRAAQNLDYGASMVVAAALGAIASRSNNRRFRLLCVVGVILLVPAHHQMADWAHLIAMPTGYFIDRARRPTARVLGLVATAAATAWLTIAGPTIVSAAAQAVRFHEFPTRPSAIYREQRRFERVEPRIVNVPYVARVLGDRPAVARVLAPLHATQPLHVIVFFHGVPGAPDDWLTGAHLDQLIAQPTKFPNTLAVLADSPGFFRPRAGWNDIPKQRTITSLRQDLLPALATRWSIDTGPRSIAVVSVGRGVNGAIALARTDRRVGWLVAVDPSRRVPSINAVASDVVMHSTLRHLRPINAHAAWEVWGDSLPGALDWLAQHGFATTTT